MNALEASQGITSLVNEAQSTNPEISKPYMVCMSNHGDYAKVRQKCESAGVVDELVSKPIFKACAHRLLMKAQNAVKGSKTVTQNDY